MTSKTQVKENKDILTLKVPIDSAYGTGRRKTSVARVWVFPGTGKIRVNNKDTKSFFKSDVLIFDLLKPLSLINQEKKLDCIITLKGGGITSQSGAARLGIARALMNLNSVHRKSLKQEGLITRDSREKERKKYGRKKARKGYQFRKR